MITSDQVAEAAKNFTATEWQYNTPGWHMGMDVAGFAKHIYDVAINDALSAIQNLPGSNLKEELAASRTFKAVRGLRND